MTEREDPMTAEYIDPITVEYNRLKEQVEEAKLRESWGKHVCSCCGRATYSAGKPRGWRVYRLPDDPGGTREYGVCRDCLKTIGYSYSDSTAPVEKNPDMVNHPDHYKAANGVECIDVIEEFLSPDEFRGYLKGQVLKYLFRAGKKDPAKETEDYEKAGWYIRKLASNSRKSDTLI